MITEIMLDQVAAHILSGITVGRYIADGTLNNAPVTDKTVNGAGEVEITLNIMPAATANITQVQLIANAADIWVKKEENIQISDYNEGILYKFILNIREEQI